MPISQILQMTREGRLDTDDLIELSPYNCNLFAYLNLKLPFKRFSPNQEWILDSFYDPESKYKELVLICGRKGGKTTIASVLILFEIYKILTLIDDPQEHYGLMPKERIYFTVVGPNKEQAQNVSFDYIKTLAKTSPYLRNYIRNETNEEMVFDKNLVVRVQTSSSRGGRGLTSMIELFDEIAHFIDNRGNLSGTEIYYALMPNLKPCAPDSRSVLITSPAGKQGVAWEQFRSGNAQHVIQETPEHDEEPWRAVFQFPTWELNPKLQFNCLTCPHAQTEAQSPHHGAKTCVPNCPSYELYLDFRSNPEKFSMEYGAEFCDTVDAAISAERVLACAIGKPIDMVAEDKVTHRIISLDPALSGNSYALVMGHQHEGMDIIDFVKYWRGDKDHPIKINIVEEFIEKLYKQFNITHIVVDQYQSASTVQRLQERGIPIFMVHVNQKYNQIAYEYFINRINMQTIIYPYHRELINELTFLQRKQLGKSVRYEASVGSQDDISDAISRLVFTLDTEGNKSIHVGFK
jgi:hypothetical protein